jgi:hypothetical protein
VNDDSSFRPTVPEKAVDKPPVSIALECGTPLVSVCIEGITRSLILLDTGSVSILKPGISSSDVRVTDARPFGVTVEVLHIKGRQTVSFRYNGREFRHTFLVCSLPTEAAGILGTDFMTQAGAMINFDCCQLMLNSNGRRPRVHCDTHIGHSAITIFTEGKEGHSPEPSKQEARQAKEPLAARPHCETVTQGKTWLVKAKENVTLAPRCRQVVMGKVEFEKGQEPPSLICIGPVQIHIEGIFPARTLAYRVERA